MIYLKKTIFFILCLFFLTQAFGQVPTQNVRGVVLDDITQSPLPMATVLVLDSDSLIGTTTNGQGEFELALPYGRYNFEFRYLGYHAKIVANTIVGAGKEVVLQVRLQELSTTLEGVVVSSNKTREETINPLASVSAVQISVEEARRYAGGMDDPARLVTSFAGVAGQVSNNGIVIRGNAPKGVLWRIEGMDVANPNHFSNISAFGAGGLTALSSFVLGNSDFYMSAFPASYGNALSGVFDLNLRNGNNQTHEHAVQMGLIGLDLASEGPLSAKKKSSYIFNYRYSTLGLLAPVLPEDAAGTGYQDVSFKLNFPLKEGSALRVWGFGAEDVSGQTPEEESANRNYVEDRIKQENKQHNGALGLEYVQKVDANTKFNLKLAYTGSRYKWDAEILTDADVLAPYEFLDNQKQTLALRANVNHKFNNQHINVSGASIQRLQYAMQLQTSEDQGESIHTKIDDQGNGWLFQGYTQSKWWVSPMFSFSLGVFTQYFSVNQDLTLEPRIGMDLLLNERSAFNFGYGKHSQIEPLSVYLYTFEGEQKNKNLEFTKAHHLVVGFQHMFDSNKRFKSELFGQSLYAVPVIENSSFSLLNLEGDLLLEAPLVNQGKGWNYGVDLTFEQFLNKGVYYLVTSSFFNSEYSGGDGVKRSSRFNKGYVLNFVAGKEWMLGKSKQNMFAVNAKVTFQGGDRISLVDEEMSHQNREVVYDSERAFSNQKPNAILAHLTINYRKNKRKHASVWTLQIMNALGSEEFYGYRYNLNALRIDPYKETLVIPNLAYKIEF